MERIGEELLEKNVVSEATCLVKTPTPRTDAFGGGRAQEGETRGRSLTQKTVG
jgi:hypothetical protein